MSTISKSDWLGRGHDNAELQLELTTDRYTFTLRELLMMRIMNSITDKPDWDTKVST